jgi:hypothetical protein
LLCIAAVVLFCASSGAALSQMSTAVREMTQAIAGLEGPAEIIVDYWGISHIYAASKRDSPRLARSPDILTLTGGHKLPMRLSDGTLASRALVGYSL